MSEPVDLMSATQQAVFRALLAGVPGHIAAVYDHIDQDTQPPFVRIGAIEAVNESDKSDQCERFEVEVHSIYRGSDRSALLAIMHRARCALDGPVLEAPDATFDTPELLAAAASDAGVDGVTYAGISKFEIYAEAA